MEFKDLVRAPEGTVVWYELELWERNNKAVLIQSYATRTKAKLQFRSINGFDMKGEPVYLLRVEVVQRGEPKKKPGRKLRGDL